MALPRATPLSLTLLLTLLFTFLLPLSTHGITNDDFDTPSAAPALPERLTLQSWPLSAPAPTPLGQIGYHARTKTGKYFPLRRDAGDMGGGGLVRIGIQTPGGGWVGTVIDGEALNPSKYNPIVTLRVDREGKVWNVEFAATTDKTQPPKVIIISSTDTSGPKPTLNKPITVGPDGKIPQQPVEKTFLQKYWWVILAGMILLMSGGGGQE